MKKQSLLILALLVSAVSYGQFFTQVPHRGAFGTWDWSQPWANWTPKETIYPGDPNYRGPVTNKVSVSGDITSNTTWSANNWYEITGIIRVRNGATLTIEAGTVIRGLATTNSADKGAILIAKGARINGVGTPDKPIVFTSGFPVGLRNRGDWSGILVVGRSHVNTDAGTRQYEALPSETEANYGGGLTPDVNDNSGILRFARIEFAGNNYLPNQELNSLTFAGVGAGTQFDFIQCSYGLDDSFEWFGGSSNHKYLIAFAGTDDDFDCDEGYNGRVQFALGVRHPYVWENAANGTSNGFEHDNNTGLNVVPGNTNPRPVTMPTFSNVTIIGPIRPGTTTPPAGSLFGRGLELRSSVATGLFNSIVTGYPQSARLTNGSATARPATQDKALTDSLIIQNTILSQFGGTRWASSNTPAAVSFNIRNWIANGNGATAVNDTSITNFNNVGLAYSTWKSNPANAIDSIDFSRADFTLFAGSPALTGSGFTNARLGTVRGSAAISSFSPASAVTGTLVTITGTNLDRTVGVSFGGRYASTFTVVNATTVTAVIPTGATTGNIVVWSLDGGAVSPQVLDVPFTFESVPFRGAMGAADWSKPWANWTPKQTVYPGDPNYDGRVTRVQISGDITTNTTWTANNWYEIRGLVRVINGATLTIEAGTVIRGIATATAADKGALLIAKGARINAVGTPEKPIVFTSGFPVGQRTRGDWSGILIVGRSHVNTDAGTRQYEALPTETEALYGGGLNPDENDNSGIIQFARVEFAGNNYLPNQELNSLTFGAVGAGTRIDNVQASFGLDDSFEWFGGSSNHKNLIAFAGSDDDYDCDEGYNGKVQYAIALRHPNVFENAANGTSNGFEHDNNTGLNVVPGNTNPTPVTMPTFSQVTIMGPIRSGETTAPQGSLFGRALELRSSSATGLFNSIVAGYPQVLRMINGSATARPATQEKALTDSLIVRYNFLVQPVGTRWAATNVPTAVSFNIRNWIANGNGATQVNDTSFTTLNNLGVVNLNYAVDATNAIDQIDFRAIDFRSFGSAAPATGAQYDFGPQRLTSLVGQVAKASANVARLFPNPANQSVTLQLNLERTSDVTLQLVDLQGRIAREVRYQQVMPGTSEAQVDLSGLTPGIYVARVATAQGVQATRLVVR